MFAFLRGKLHSKAMLAGAADVAVVDVGGVGYELSISRRTLLQLPSPGEDATLFTALSIRETGWTLFGFATLDERQVFELLQTVTGVGPKLALALNATFGPEELAEAIVAGDQKMISQAPGVGAKVAQRLILELKSKMEEWLQERRLHSVNTSVGPWNEVSDEVRGVLETLGYTATEVNLALKRAKEEQIPQEVELMVQFSLKTLGTSTVS